MKGENRGLCNDVRNFTMFGSQYESVLDTTLSLQGKLDSVYPSILSCDHKPSVGTASCVACRKFRDEVRTM